MMITRLSAVCSLVVTSALILDARMQGSLVIERTATGQRVRFQDPDFDNQWREYEIPAADRVRIATKTVVKSYSQGLWSYEYLIENERDSVQHVVSFRVQAAYGASVLAPPFGWNSTQDALSTVTWSATEGNEVVPGDSRGGCSIVSDNLPAVRDAEIRGALTTDFRLSDLPRAVQAAVEDIERHNVKRARVLAPGIPTRVVTLGREGLRDPVEIFEDVRYRYVLWLREAAEEADDRIAHSRAQAARTFESNVAWVDRVASQLTEVHRILQTDRRAGRNYLREWLQTLRREERDFEWLESLRGVLVLALEYVGNELR